MRVGEGVLGNAEDDVEERRDQLVGTKHIHKKAKAPKNIRYQTEPVSKIILLKILIKNLPKHRDVLLPPHNHYL